MQGQKHHDGSHFIIRHGQAGNADRKNSHFRESYIGRVCPALRVNRAEVSLRAFYPRCALYTPCIRRHSTSSHQLRGPRRPPGVPCAVVTPLQSPFSGLQWHLLVTHKQECDQLQASHMTQELLTLLAQLFSLRCRSRLLPFIVVAVALLWRCYSNRSSRCLSPVEM